MEIEGTTRIKAITTIKTLKAQTTITTIIIIYYFFTGKLREPL